MIQDPHQQPPAEAPAQRPAEIAARHSGFPEKGPKNTELFDRRPQRTTPESPAEEHQHTVQQRTSSPPAPLNVLPSSLYPSKVVNVGNDLQTGTGKQELPSEPTDLSRDRLYLTGAEEARKPPHAATGLSTVCGRYGVGDVQIPFVQRLVDRQIELLGEGDRNLGCYLLRAAEAVRDGVGHALDAKLGDFKQAIAAGIVVRSRPAYFHAMWQEARAA